MVFLLAAGIFGILIGWLFKRFFAVKHNNTQLNLFEAERKLHQQDMAQLEANWQKKYSALNKERHKIKSLLQTQEQENLRLLNSIKINQQALNALEVDFATLKNEQLAVQDLHDQLESARRQNAILAKKYAFMKAAVLPDGLPQISDSDRVSREAWVRQARILDKEKYGEDV